MSKRVAIRLVVLIGACVVVAGAAAFWITRPAVPFDEAFRECKQDEAEWRLVVNYSIVGIDGDEKFVAHYCHRQPPKTSVVSGSWLHWWEPSVDEWEEVGGPGILKEFSHACGIGTDGNWVCNYSTKAGTQTAAGVDLSVEHGRSGDPASVISETISLPFPETVACRKGKISYVATWESLK